MDAPETEAMLARIRMGDRQALGLLFEQFRPRLKSYLRLRMDRRLSARVSDSDVLQEVYLDLSQQIEAYLRNPRVHVYVWLRGLARERLQKIGREHLGAQRRTVNRECRLPARSSVALARQLLAAEPSPSQQLASAELRQQIRAALAALKPEDREILLMREFEQMTNGEAAQALGLSDSAATMRYGRALVRLKQRLKRELGEGGVSG